MSLFTEKERADLCYMHDNDPEKLFDATVAAVLEKLAAGVSVEPVAAMFAGEDSIKFNKRSRVTLDDKWHELFTLDQLTTAIAAARVAALEEECAKLCEDLYEASGHDVEYGGCISAANAIRDLMGKEST